MGTQFSRVPHDLLDMIFKGEIREKDVRLLAYFYRRGSHQPITEDGVYLLEGQVSTSYQAIATDCRLTVKESRAGVKRLIVSGHIAKVCEIRSGRNGKRQHSVYNVAGLLNPRYYDAWASKRASTEEPKIAADAGVFQSEEPSIGQANGQALDEKGQALDATKTDILSCFSDIGDSEPGRHLFIYQNGPKGSMCSNVQWTALSDAEKRDVLQRIGYGLQLWTSRAARADTDDQKAHAAQRVRDFSAWDERLQTGSPDEQEEAFRAYLDSSV